MLYSPSQQGFFSTEVHAEVPADALPVSADRMTELFDGQSQGAEIVPGPDGAPTLLWPTSPSEAEGLVAARASASLAVDQAVAAIRRAFITDLPAQEMIYLAKEAEAHAFLAASTPVLAEYPFLAAESGITAATPTELATLWLALAAQWRALAAQIEAARMTATAAIAAATTPAAAETAAEALRDALATILAAARQPANAE